MADKTPQAESSEENDKLAPGDEIILSAADQELSVEALDNFLSESDPEFSKKMGELKSDKSLSFAEVELSEEEQALADEKDWWSNNGKILKVIFLIFPLAPRLSLGIKKLKYKFFVLLRGLWVRTKNFGYFLRTAGKDKTIYFVKSSIKVFTGFFLRILGAFKDLPLKLKIVFLLLVLATVGVGYIVKKILENNLLPKEKTLFIQNFDQVANQVYKFDPSKNMEPLFDNLRTSSNVYLMPRMVVNIRQSESSGDNPMAALEIFVEGMTPEVAVEIKDRESEFRDFLQRELEQLDYDTLLSPDGKIETLEKLKIEMNKLLVSGKIRRIYLKTLILKP